MIAPNKTVSISLLLALAGQLTGLDKIRIETRVDQAIAKYGVTGKGVIYAMIDRGIDWQNNDFRNADGTTRIAYIFDMTDNTGAKAANNPYGVGTVYTQAQINQALQGGPAIPERDYLGHGTANTAAAAGGGRNNATYTGIAPGATIVAVKYINDATPAFGSTPAIPSFFNSTYLPIALQFVTDKAKELNMPCVMVLDSGSIGGPTDGTSASARLIDATVGNQPGLIMIPATGDDGGTANHASTTVPQGGNIVLKFNKGLAGGLSFDLWYAGSDLFDVSIKTPDTTYGPFVAPANTSFDFQTSLGELAYYAYGASARSPYDAMNGKRELNLTLAANSPNGEYDVTLTGRTSVNGSFDATINPSHEWDGSVANYFLNYAVPGSLADTASAHNGVTTSTYVIRTNWTDVNSIARGLVGQGVIGAVWNGQSTGPTFDGRRGLDLTTPGETIMTAYDPKSYWATSTGNEILGGGGLYGAAGANSSANPVMAGIIALMLQMNPKLDAFTVKDILHKSAKTDSFTGSTPNNTWGFDKIDALNALDLIAGVSRPKIAAVVNAASFAPGGVAPGEIFAITGQKLGPSVLALHDDFSQDAKFIGAANGTEVLFDGVPAPMIYTSAGQIAGVVPYAVASKSSTSIQVLYEGVASQAVSVPVSASNPAIFLAPALGASQAAVLNQDFTINTAGNPEARGNIVVLFATGEGQTAPAGIDGLIANIAFPKPLLPVSVTIGGVPAAVLYYGAAPSEIAGLMQLNVRIPADAPTGGSVPIVLKVGANASPGPATIAVN